MFGSHFKSRRASSLHRLAVARFWHSTFDPGLMLLAALPGIALALWIYGPALNPSHVEWLLAEGDSLQHFSGWDMFRRDEWRWPSTRVAASVPAL